MDPLISVTVVCKFPSKNYASMVSQRLEVTQGTCLLSLTAACFPDATVSNVALFPASKFLPGLQNNGSLPSSFHKPKTLLPRH